MHEFMSTRNNMEKVSASLAVLKGLADDGGLFMLNDFSKIQVDLNQIVNMDYHALAKYILGLLLDDYHEAEISQCVEKAYCKFDCEEVTPLVSVGEDYVLELFHGPTSAFKDVALSILPYLVTTALKKNKCDDEIIILTATSGDTGKAALEGFKDVDGCQIFVFFPDKGVSAVQKAQMITQQGKNVHVAAIKGNFDDAQNSVKTIFNNREYDIFMKEHKMQFSSANSINIGRLTPQVVYYFKAYADLVNQKTIKNGDLVNFVVPTGNFGNILAGYFAKMMGLPIAKLVCASNENNVLTEFMHTGCYNRNRVFKKTNSPSMDILISSNLERLLYLLSECNSEEVNQYMTNLKETGKYQICNEMLSKLHNEFYAGFATNEETQKMIHDVYQSTHYLMDTHTAVAYKVCDDFKQAKVNSYPNIILSTASPYKFTQSVYESLFGHCELNEFVLMKELSNKTNTPIPEGLKNLDQLTILHDTVIEKELIADYLFKKLGE